MYYEKNGCICCKEMMRKFTEAGLDLYNKEHLEFISSNAEAGGVSKSRIQYYFVHDIFEL